MTNVPNNIREIWADVYRLYDVNYDMPKSPTAWQDYWQQVEAITKKHGSSWELTKMIVLVTELLEERQAPLKHPCSLEDMNLF